jgi:hypothetical protein
LRLAGGEGGELAPVAGHLGLRLLELEAGTGAGAGKLAVLRDAQLGELKLAGHALLLVGHLLDLLFVALLVGLGADQLGAQLVDIGLRCPHLDLERQRVDAKQHVALLDRAVRFDGHFRHAPRHARHDLDRVVDHAHVVR